MNALQYRDLLKQLGLTQGKAAKLLGVSIRTSHAYANGATIPEPSARFLLSLLKDVQPVTRSGRAHRYPARP